MSRYGFSINPTPGGIHCHPLRGKIRGGPSHKEVLSGHANLPTQDRDTLERAGHQQVSTLQGKHLAHVFRALDGNGGQNMVISQSSPGYNYAFPCRSNNIPGWCFSGYHPTPGWAKPYVSILWCPKERPVGKPAPKSDMHLGGSIPTIIEATCPPRHLSWESNAGKGGHDRLWKLGGWEGHVVHTKSPSLENYNRILSLKLQRRATDPRHADNTACIGDPHLFLQWQRWALTAWGWRTTGYLLREALPPSGSPEKVEEQSIFILITDCRDHFLAVYQYLF